MSKFTSKEQIIINKIIELNNDKKDIIVFNLLSHFFDEEVIGFKMSNIPHGFKVNTETGDLIFQFKKIESNNNTLIQDSLPSTLTIKLVIVLNLIDLLYKQNLLLLYKYADYPDKWAESNPELAFTEISSYESTPDVKFKNFIKKYIDKAIIPSGDLISIQENNFKTDEELRFEEQFKDEQRRHRENLKKSWDNLEETKKHNRNTITQMEKQLFWTKLIAIAGIFATIGSILFYAFTYFWPTDKVISNEKTTKELIESIEKLPSKIKTENDNQTFLLIFQGSAAQKYKRIPMLQRK